MTRAIALARAPFLNLQEDVLRSAIVCGCALALILAGSPFAG
jgi:hypothetical protein